MNRESKRPKARDQLKALQVAPSKSRGQNFIINPFVVESILNFGMPQAGEALVEIGPGLGALTGALYDVALNSNVPLTLIEIEPRLCEELAKRYPQARIVQADVRTVDFSELGTKLSVFGNLPYSFSTEIIFHSLKHRASIRRAVFMLQREFAERVAAEPGGKEYGSLSVAVQLWADAVLGPIIPGDAFHPPTKVESRMLAMHLRTEPRVEVPDQALFERVVRAAFSKRRRTIENSIESSGSFTAEQVARALAAAGVSPDRRGETLSMEEFSALARAFAVD